MLTLPASAPRSLRVGLFCDCDSRGGVFAYSCQLAEALRQHETAVDIITLGPTHAGAEENLETLSRVADDIHVLPAQASQPERVAQIRARLESLALDAFIPNYRHTTYAACAGLSRTQGVKIVGICHNDHESYYSLLRYYGSIIDGFVAASQKTRRAMNALFPRRAADIRWLPHGIDTPPLPRPDFRGGTLRMVYHGRLEEEQKAVSQLIRLAEALRHRGVDFELTLIGDNTSGIDYAAMAAHHGVARQVRIEPSLPRDMLLTQLPSYHLAVLSSRYEGFCLGLAEAMSLGLPAVAFRSRVIEEYVIDAQTGLLAPWGDVASLADRVARLAAEPEEWQRLSRAARDLIRTTYTPEAFASGYAEFLHDLVDRPGLRRWPRYRPIVAVPEEQPWRHFVDRVGQRLHLWK